MAGNTLEELIKINDQARQRMEKAMDVVAKGKKIDPNEASK